MTDRELLTLAAKAAGIVGKFENNGANAGIFVAIEPAYSAGSWTRWHPLTDNELGELLVQFTYRQRDVTVKASYRGYAAAWLREHPYNPSRHHRTEKQHEARALDQAQISVCSVLRDWIKGQITAVEVGILTFEGAFLGQIMLPGTGQTVLEAVQASNMLPALEGPKP